MRELVSDIIKHPIDKHKDLISLKNVLDQFGESLGEIFSKEMGLNAKKEQLLSEIKELKKLSESDSSESELNSVISKDQRVHSSAVELKNFNSSNQFKKSIEPFEENIKEKEAIERKEEKIKKIEALTLEKLSGNIKNKLNSLTEGIQKIEIFLKTPVNTKSISEFQRAFIWPLQEEINLLFNYCIDHSENIEAKKILGNILYQCEKLGCLFPSHLIHIFDQLQTRKIIEEKPDNIQILASKVSQSEEEKKLLLSYFSNELNKFEIKSSLSGNGEIDNKIRDTEIQYYTSRAIVTAEWSLNGLLKRNLSDALGEIRHLARIAKSKSHEFRVCRLPALRSIAAALFKCCQAGIFKIENNNIKKGILAFVYESLKSIKREPAFQVDETFNLTQYYLARCYLTSNQDDYLARGMVLLFKLAEHAKSDLKKGYIDDIEELLNTNNAAMTIYEKMKFDSSSNCSRVVLFLPQDKLIKPEIKESTQAKSVSLVFDIKLNKHQKFLTSHSFFVNPQFKEEQKIIKNLCDLYYKWNKKPDMESKGIYNLVKLNYNKLLPASDEATFPWLLYNYFCDHYHDGAWFSSSPKILLPCCSDEKILQTMEAKARRLVPYQIDRHVLKLSAAPDWRMNGGADALYLTCAAIFWIKNVCFYVSNPKDVESRLKAQFECQAKLYLKEDAEDDSEKNDRVKLVLLYESILKTANIIPSLGMFPISKEGKEKWGVNYLSKLDWLTTTGLFLFACMPKKNRLRFFSDLTEKLNELSVKKLTPVQQEQVTRVKGVVKSLSEEDGLSRQIDKLLKPPEPEKGFWSFLSPG